LEALRHARAAQADADRVLAQRREFGGASKLAGRAWYCFIGIGLSAGVEPILSFRTSTCRGWTGGNPAILRGELRGRLQFPGRRYSLTRAFG
jgi:hypothetical protein